MNLAPDPLIDAAFAVFSRRGLRKATMGDIATEAGVSRQTLYNRFENKDQVFRAAGRYLGQKQLDTMLAQWAAADTLGERIESFYACGPVFWYDTICQTPESADLIEAIHALAPEDLAAVHAQWITGLADMLQPYDNVLGKSGTTPADLADFLYSSAYTAKTDCQDRVHLLRRLAVLKAAVLALTGTS